MQDLKNSSAGYKILLLGRYKFEIDYDLSISYQRYACESYTGLIFITEDGDKYDVVNNYSMGFRLLINNKDGWKDIPFNSSTFWFLPPGIIVEEV